jgi:hypothetical protein
LSEPDDLKNCRFFEAGCKVTTSYQFNQIFRVDFEDLFLLVLTRIFEELFAFLRADGKDTGSIFISKLFLSLVIHISTLHLLAICKELVQFATLFPLSFSLAFSLLSSLFSGCLFQIGLQR